MKSIFIVSQNLSTHMVLLLILRLQDNAMTYMETGLAQTGATRSINQFNGANIHWSDNKYLVNCSQLGVTAGVFFLLVGCSGRKVAQLRLVLVLTHEVQLSRVAVLAAESLRSS